MLAAPLGLLCTTPARAATYYAGPSGCSDSGEGSATAPFCTLKSAVGRLKAGDTLNVLNGTFKESLSISAVGTAANPVVIQADPDAYPVIDGQGLALKDVGLVDLSGAKHITLRGLTVQNSATSCLRVSNADNVTIDKLRITGCDHGGLVALKTTNLKITDGEIGNTGRCSTGPCSDEGLTLSGVSDFVVSTSWIHQGSKDGISIRDGSRSGKVFSNVVQEMGVGINLIQASTVDVHDNDIHQNRQSGIQLTTGAAVSGIPLASRNQFYRNLLWNNTQNGIRFSVQATGEMRENKIYNNDFFGNTLAGIQLGDNTLVVKDNILRNNIFMNNTEGSILGGAAAANTISHCLFAPPQTTVGSNSVVGDPLFASSAFGNFHLTAKSPAIDAGFEMGLPKVGAPDIGAFEFGLAVIPDASKNDAASGPAGPAGPDPGCGCSSGWRAEQLAEGWPLALLGIAMALGRRARNRISGKE